MLTTNFKIGPWERTLLKKDRVVRSSPLLPEIRASMKTDFPLTARQAAEMRAVLRERVLRIHDLEVKAIETLQALMA